MIESVWAWVMVDEDGNEAVASMPHHDIVVPLVFPEEARGRRFTSQVRNAAKSLGVPARYVRFDRAEVLRETAP